MAPLAVATGAGSEMRQSLGTAVFFGMLGVTGFGLLFTPAFYTVVRQLGGRAVTRRERAAPGAGERRRVGPQLLSSTGVRRCRVLRS